MKSKFYIYFLLVFSVLFSCKDVLEEDISNKEIKLYSPSNNFKSGSFTQTFWWEEIEGVRKYQLEVVSLSKVKGNNGVAYDTIALLFDTMATKNKITLPLKPGFFQWRVRGHNAGYKSNYSETRMFEIDSVTINGQDLLMKSPGNDVTGIIYTKENKYILEWHPLVGAKQYVIEKDSNGVVKSETIASTLNKYTVNFNSQNFEYKVTVQAKANLLYSNKSSVYTFVYDATKPDSVKIGEPLLNDGKLTIPWELLDENNKSGIVYFKINYTKNSSTTQSSRVDIKAGEVKYLIEIPFVLNDKITFSITSYDRTGNSFETNKHTYPKTQ